MGVKLSTVAIGGKKWKVAPQLVKDLLALNIAYKHQFGVDVPITQTYRPTGKPSDKASATPKTQWSAYKWYELHGSPTAMYPGTSKHEKGTAVDFGGRVAIKGTAEWKWMKEHGPRFGFVWGEAPSEAWHFVHNSATQVYHPPVKSTKAMPTIRKGSKNKSAVLAAQRALVKHGLALKTDGIFGPDTEAKVKAFQKKHHLTVDGIIGPQTWKALGL